MSLSQVTSKSLRIGDDLEFLYLLLAYTTTPDLWNVRNQAKDLMIVGKQFMYACMYACTYACTHGCRN